ncbi:alpha-hydroxy-acid oxidizing protein [Microbulbifer okhotskensis]|uniref:alpha-hydroxy-acid oxidizing protein n=1 Tax=Microbulbifer okhotskensis TaxID=2926617 RepID=UPI00359CA17A
MRAEILCFRIHKASKTPPQFAFLGRFFMYSVCALGDKGANHAIYLLKVQLVQMMQQLGRV